MPFLVALMHSFCTQVAHLRNSRLSLMHPNDTFENACRKLENILHNSRQGTVWHLHEATDMIAGR